MRKRGAAIRHRARSIPGVVVQYVAEDYELRLRSSVSAFRLGYAEGAHFDDILDCCDLIRIGEHLSPKKDDGAVAAGEAASIALHAIRKRYDETATFNASEQEMLAFEQLANASMSFWNRRSGALYSAAYQQLKHIRAKQSQQAKQGGTA